MCVKCTSKLAVHSSLPILLKVVSVQCFCPLLLHVRELRLLCKSRDSKFIVNYIQAVSHSLHAHCAMHAARLLALRRAERHFLYRRRRRRCSTPSLAALRRRTHCGRLCIKSLFYLGALLRHSHKSFTVPSHHPKPSGCLIYSVALLRARPPPAATHESLFSCTSTMPGRHAIIVQHGSFVPFARLLRLAAAGGSGMAKILRRWQQRLEWRRKVRRSFEHGMPILRVFFMNGGRAAVSCARFALPLYCAIVLECSHSPTNKPAQGFRSPHRPDDCLGTAKTSPLLLEQWDGESQREAGA